MSSSFGTIFKATTFGESHGAGVGVVVDGCPPGLPLTEADVQPQLDRRRPGQSRGDLEAMDLVAAPLQRGAENAVGAAHVEDPERRRLGDQIEDGGVERAGIDRRLVFVVRLDSIAHRPVL